RSRPTRDRVLQRELHESRREREADMKTMKTTLLAIAVSTAAAGTAHAQSVDWQIVDHDITVDDVRNYETNTIDNTQTTTTDFNGSVDVDVDLALSAAYDGRMVDRVNRRLDQTATQSLDEAHRIRSNEVYEDIERTEVVN